MLIVFFFFFADVFVDAVALKKYSENAYLFCFFFNCFSVLIFLCILYFITLFLSFSQFFSLSIALYVLQHYFICEYDTNLIE